MLSRIDVDLAVDPETVAVYSMLALVNGNVDDQATDLLQDYILPVATEVCVERAKAKN